MAQNPFGGPRPAAEPQVGGIIGWILTKQSEFYREMSATIRAAKSDGSAVWTLLGISFAYGIFHAAGPGGWQRGLGAIFAVGMRPCSGAILVLVFSLAQGLFWAGIAATFVMGLGTAITVATIAVIAVSAKGLARRLSAGREGGGTLIMRGIEFGAAGLVLLFGLGLLFGYLAAERATCL
jgi:ABC-type nickel/cobalt efflux system permease component RcnA